MDCCESEHAWINDRCATIIERQETTLKTLEIVVGIRTDSYAPSRVSGEEGDPRLEELQRRLDRIEDLTGAILNCATRIRETIG